ncbi:MAG: lamin tail domain-containing protein, partial [Planctomycetales bacterium]|nr:lamin tail domain-containing protein [Planctomycetales bacterium]
MSFTRLGRRPVKRRPLHASNFLSLEALEARTLLAADVVISEFVASNDTGLLDGFGANSDWLELTNQGDTAANLSGMYLTNDPDNLTQWVFPDGQTLAPGGYLIVFASGRDVQDEAGNLHTNFRLNRDGDYLALVDSTGVVVSEIGANGTKFPQQLTDVSYGLYQTTVATEFIRSDSSAQLFVPTDNSLSSSWTSPEFDAGSWSSVTAGVGYDRTPSQGAPILGGNAILNIDFDDDDSGEQGADNTEAGWTQMTLSDGTLTVNGIQVTISAV